MKIKINWNASSNISFKGSEVIEMDQEDFDDMTEEELDEHILDMALEMSGFECWHEVISEDNKEDNDE